MDLIIRYLTAMAFFLGVLLFWFFIQNKARKFARQHPEFGRVREEGGGCGGGGKCNCGSIKNCVKQNNKPKI